jgi:hypothetical protein
MPHPASAFVEVPYPPPPARPEQLPDPPDVAGAVWIDGEWAWRGRSWGWTYGRWVRVPENAAFAPSRCRFDSDAVLVCARGTWYLADGTELRHPRELATATANEGNVVDEEGNRIDVGPNRKARRERRGRPRRDDVPAPSP